MSHSALEIAPVAARRARRKRKPRCRANELESFAFSLDADIQFCIEPEPIVLMALLGVAAPLGHPRSDQAYEAPGGC